MKYRSRHFAAALIVFLSIGVFAAAGYLRAAESDRGTIEGQKAIMEGAKKMMDGNKMIMETVAGKGMKDAEFTAAEKMMTDGFNMVTKGEGMMTGNTISEGKAMVTRGAKMMLEAQKATAAAVEKKGLVTVCSSGLDMCMTGEKKINLGLEGS
jgi:hypothetical protein